MDQDEADPGHVLPFHGHADLQSFDLLRMAVPINAAALCMSV